MEGIEPLNNQTEPKPGDFVRIRVRPTNEVSRIENHGWIVIKINTCLTKNIPEKEGIEIYIIKGTKLDDGSVIYVQLIKKPHSEPTDHTKTENWDLCDEEEVPHGHRYKYRLDNKTYEQNLGLPCYVLNETQWEQITEFGGEVPLGNVDLSGFEFSSKQLENSNKTNETIPFTETEYQQKSTNEGSATPAPSQSDRETTMTGCRVGNNYIMMGTRLIDNLNTVVERKPDRDQNYLKDFPNIQSILKLEKKLIKTTSKLECYMKEQGWYMDTEKVEMYRNLRERWYNTGKNYRMKIKDLDYQITHDLKDISDKTLEFYNDLACHTDTDENEFWKVILSADQRLLNIDNTLIYAHTETGQFKATSSVGSLFGPNHDLEDNDPEGNIRTESNMVQLNTTQHDSYILSKLVKETVDEIKTINNQITTKGIRDTTTERDKKIRDITINTLKEMKLNNKDNGTKDINHIEKDVKSSEIKEGAPQTKNETKRIDNKKVSDPSSYDSSSSSSSSSSDRKRNKHKKKKKKIKEIKSK